MEFVRLKYANNKLINANLKEHREIIEEYILKKNMEYFGFVPVLFGPSGKILEIDLIFKKPKDEKSETTQKNTKQLKELWYNLKWYGENYKILKSANGR